MIRRPRSFAALSAVLLAPLAVAADDTMVPPGLYAVKSQMVMPHLDEMRRIIKQEQQCVIDDPASLFSVLRQGALHGCKLGYPKKTAQSMNYVLVCQTAMVATGHIAVEPQREAFIGTMEIKMGGKNMTFTQRIEATRLGDCAK